MKLHEVASRGEQLKSIFAQAVDQTIAKYADEFGDKGSAAKKKLHHEMTKNQLAAALQDAGVSNASDIAQAIIKAGNALDK